MFIEFSVSNFQSIKDKVTLSLVKAKGMELVDTNTFKPSAPTTPALLHSAAIYGANAAGKSNTIYALLIMREIVLDSSNKNHADELLPITPFLLDNDSENEPTEFEVIFISHGVRYQYGFQVSSSRVLEEWLLAYPKGRPQRLIERVYDPKTKEYVWGSMDKLSGQKQIWQDTTRDNALFLSTAIQLNNEQLKPVFDWFSNTLHVTGVEGWSPSYTEQLCETQNKKKDIITFLKDAGIDIDDIELEKEKFSTESLPADMPTVVKKEIEKVYSDKEIINVKTVHFLDDGKRKVFDIAHESDGTQKMFSFAGPWLDTLANGHVLVIDELHDNLHPNLVKFLVELFHNKSINKKHAQLIFVTHDTSILNQHIFRRDQIWFCEKNKNKSTTLYPLTDFSPRKGVENLEDNYLKGRYGGLPYIKRIS